MVRAQTLYPGSLSGPRERAVRLLPNLPRLGHNSGPATSTLMMTLKITAGPFTFDARLETEAAPKTCTAFYHLIPFKSQIVHVRWSWGAVWIPLAELDFAVCCENHTSYPAPARSTLYPRATGE